MGAFAPNKPAATVCHTSSRASQRSCNARVIACEAALGVRHSSSCLRGKPHCRGISSVRSCLANEDSGGTCRTCHTDNRLAAVPIPQAITESCCDNEQNSEQDNTFRFHCFSGTPRRICCCRLKTQSRSRGPAGRPGPWDAWMASACARPPARQTRDERMRRMGAAA
jgi:hypothetical protein